GFLRIAAALADAGVQYGVRAVVARVNAECAARAIARMRGAGAVNELVPLAGGAAQHGLVLAAIGFAMVEVHRQAGRVGFVAERQACVEEYLVVVAAELRASAAQGNAIGEPLEVVVVANLELGVATM